MRQATHARRAGRALRRRLDPTFSLSAEELFQALRRYLEQRTPEKAWSVEVFPSPSRRLRGRKAAITPGKIDYDRALDGDPALRLHVVAHEVGHALHHRRVHELSDLPDPAQVMTSASSQRGLAEARYSPVVRDEVQAEAFAVEFMCPADAAMELWASDLAATSRALARRFLTTAAVVRAQLGEALHERLVGGEAQAPDATASTGTGTGARSPDTKQTAAIEHTGTAALVDAGPGCGKTFTLVERVAWVIEEDVRIAEEALLSDSEVDDAWRDSRRQEAAEHILVLTFSTEAASELDTRLATRLPSVASAIEAATFHGFGRQLLATFGKDIDVARNAPVLDEAAQAELVSDVLGAPGVEPILDLKSLDASAQEAVRHIQHVKLKLTADPDSGLPTPWTPALLAARLDELEGEEPPEDEEEASARRERLAIARAFTTLFGAYEEAKRAREVVDFADLVALSITVLREHPGAATYYRRRYRHVLVDEFQDVSRAVALFLELLCGPDGQPWVVGDPNQAIYRFLNADPENLARFPDSFRGADVFELESNYRSSGEIVGVANELAALLKHAEDEAAAAAPPRFSAIGNPATPRPDAVPPVTIAVAESDAAERVGVADTVAGWIDQQVPPHEIAVLARRNIDVQEIALALGARGIKTTTGAIMTPEGTAGDLAAVTTFADGRSGFRASLPRVAYALSRDRYPVDTIDAAVELILDRLAPGDERSVDDALDVDAGTGDMADLIAEIRKTYHALRGETFAGDAFTVLATFLFDGSDYVRRLLALAGGDGEATSLAEVTAVLRLAEASSALAQAAAYRHARPRSGGEEAQHEDDVQVVARRARLSFAADLRRRLTDGIPTPVVPPRAEGAVQVMTCHASKGLEFPFVCVVGQTLSPLSSSYEWLPDELDLQPGDTQDAEQADALFFVAATRAQSALVVSFAERPNAGNGKPRAVTPLVERWMRTSGYPKESWAEPPDSEDPIESVDAIWGRHGTPRLAPYHLDSRTCQLSTYVEELARLRFPEVLPPLYPHYVSCMRFVLAQVIKAAHERGSGVPPEVADTGFQRAWRRIEGLYPEHPHLGLFRRIGRRVARAFCTAYAQPLATEIRPLDMAAIEASLHPDHAIQVGLLAAFVADDGRPVAFLLRAESYAAKVGDRGHLNWSDLRSSRQLPLAVFHQHVLHEHDEAVAFVFSAADGALYPFAWSRRSTSMSTLHGRANAQLKALVAGPFAPNVSGWTCARCRSRILCPHYLRTMNA